MHRRLLLVAALISVYLVLDWVRGWPRGGVSAPPVTLGEEPFQEALPEPLPIQVHRDGRTFFLLQTHRFAVSGHVLSATEYDLAWTNDFFDVDLGLAWGDQVDRLLDQYDFRQNARWLFWQADRPIDEAERRYVTTHVGNLHLIPAEGRPTVDRALRWARKGDRVRIEGTLVTIQDAGTNELARSSTTRDDTGGGACEIVYVTRFQNGDTVWE